MAEDGRDMNKCKLYRVEGAKEQLDAGEKHIQITGTYLYAGMIVRDGIVVEIALILKHYFFFSICKECS